MKSQPTVLMLLATALTAGLAIPATARAQDRPNILLIVVDDMGYSDLGSFGGEVRTPNIDALAHAGVRMTSFYAAPSCSPTRSMLLTGTDNHLAGLGNMAETMAPNQKGKPGYEGYLNDRVVTIARLLRDSGYHTYVSGKWHLGEAVEQDPFHRGFERSYVLLQGGASHFDDEWMMCANYTPIYRENGVRVHVPRGFFSSRFYTDKLIEQIDSAEDDKPFFAYLAYTAPHDPLHLPEEWLDKYRGRYDGGYDKLRAERLARMQKAGLVAADVQLSRRLAMMPPWDSLTAEQRRVAARKMELHAAMIENMDHHLGRLIKHLEQRGDLDNTLVIFFSDNGAAPTEVHNYPGTTKEWVERNSDNRFENMGRRGSRISIGLPWAVASNTPLRYFKGLITEGGIRVPLIVRGPGVKRGGQISAAFAHVTDLAPTILEVAGVTHPRRYKGRAVLPLRGKSLVPFLAGKADRIRSDQEPVGWEAFGYRAVRQGRWKATWLPQPLGSGDWQLFDLQRDPTERDDLAASQAAKLRELVAVYASYSKEVGVVLPSSAPRIGR